MRHVFFALFSEQNEADAALGELRDADRQGQHCQVAVHRHKIDNEASAIVETRARARTTSGVLLGGAIGAAFGGAVLGAEGLVGTGPLNAALICGGLGALFGALGGALSGLGAPDPNLERMSERLGAGGVILTVEADAGFYETLAETIVKRHGAEVARHATI